MDDGFFPLRNHTNISKSQVDSVFPFHVPCFSAFLSIVSALLHSGAYSFFGLMFSPFCAEGNDKSLGETVFCFEPAFWNGD